MKSKNVFVVGCFRSGTTLLAAILDASKEISFIRTETRFVGGLLDPGLRNKMKKAGDLSEDNNVRELVDSIYTDTVTRYCYEWLRSNVKKEYFLERLLATDRSDYAIFKTILDIHLLMYGDGKSIIGEKTPSHIYHVPTLLRWFNDARIVHIIRDPRAVLVSQINRRRKNRAKKFVIFPFTYLNFILVFIEVIHTTIAWLYAASLHSKYKRIYPDNYYLLRYEDLIIKPESSIKQLCDFLDITFTDEMLNIKVMNSSFTDQFFGNEGFNSNAIDRWREYISPWMNIWIAFFTRKYLKKFSYL